MEGRAPIRTSFFTVYPQAVGTPIETVPSHANHCGQCHYDFSGGGPRNPYGVRLGQVLGNYPNNDSGRQQAIRFIENEDPDGDGYSSLTEITDTVNFGNTPTFSGLTPVNVSNVLNVSVVEIQGHLVPTTGSDTTPPTVTVLSPDGGELLFGNSMYVVQWTASDASGIAGIDIYLSEDNGLNYRAIALGLANTGNHLWFPPNRPSTTARVRVYATDNALNEGYDTSNGVFEVRSPEGGIVPTTLRDFDQPGTQPFDSTALNDPSTCAVCHGNYNPAVEPFFNWKGSMMAHASRDTLFEACMAIANQDAPDSGDLCLRCHLPRGWLDGRSVPTSGAAMVAADRSGVSCDLCHRMVDPFYDPAASPAEDLAILAALEQVPDDYGNGMFVVDPSATRRGPFVDAASGHPILVSPFHREAAFCGTCHDVSNPEFEKDGQGNYVPNAFDQAATNFSAHALMPIERTYSEWFYSAFNSPQGVYAPQFGGNRSYVGSCQDCHMRAVTGQGCNFGNPPTRTDLPLHDMTGGSTWLPAVLAALYPGEMDLAAVQAGVARARYMLQHAAELSAVQNSTTLIVTVTNHSGHKLPTGYPEGRRMWLNVKYFDGTMTLLGESGAYEASTGVLTHDPEVKIYEAKPGLDSVTAPLVGVTEGPSFHFVLNNKIFKDNRIPPRGFQNNTFALFGGTPVGAVYADGQHWDETEYTIPVGSVSAEVTLYYQSTSREYVEFLRDENVTNDRGQLMYDLWNSNGKSPPEMMRTMTLPLSPPQACCRMDGTCADLDEATCLAGGGTSLPGAACTASEACCLADRTCVEVAAVCCVVSDGEPQGQGVYCGPGSCPECENDIDCDDGAYCNGMETCDEVAGSCRTGDPPDCDDGVACTVDFCDEVSDMCVHTPNNGDCNDGLYCNGVEVCDAVLGCRPGLPPDCDDGVACTVDGCDEDQDNCTHWPDHAVCSDGLFCNGPEECDPSAGCRSVEFMCPAGLTCDEDLDACVGCVSDADCSDGTVCNGLEQCVDTVCRPGEPLACDDGNNCTDDTCDPAEGCVWMPNHEPCDDDNACTVDDRCEGGACVGGAPAVCDDGDVCTDDSCDAVLGCRYVDNSAECNDGNRCTINDHCVSGACTGSPIVIRYGDVYPPGGDGIVEVGDVLVLLAAYGDPDPCANVPTANLTYNGGCPQSCTSGSECPVGICSPVTGECCDLVEVSDVLAILDAYAGTPPCDDPCSASRMRVSLGVRKGE